MCMFIKLTFQEDFDSDTASISVVRAPMIAFWSGVDLKRCVVGECVILMLENRFSRCHHLRCRFDMLQCFTYLKFCSLILLLIAIRMMRFRSCCWNVTRNWLLLVFVVETSRKLYKCMVS